MGFVDYETDGPFLLIDTSYLTYCIAFRSLNIYKKHYDVPSDPEELYKVDFTEDGDFLSIFNRNFVSSIKKLHSQFMTSASKTIFALDCPKKDIWRRSFFEGYKAHRMVQVGPPAGLNSRPIFKHLVDKLLPGLIDRGFGTSMYLDHCEADDIIGITHSFIRANERDRKIVILASDHDLMQLLDKNTEIMTTMNTNMKDKSCGDPARDLLKKKLIGDGSDGIPSCFTKVKGDPVLSRGFGNKACEKLLDDRDLLEAKFEQYPEAREQFKINHLIVDFENIPDELRSKVTKMASDLIYG
jgi:5'-3' exonuclease